MKEADTTPGKPHSTQVALVVGATGATGRALMQRLIDHPVFGKIYVVHRRPTPYAHQEKVEEIQIDFDHLASLTLPESVDHMFCCIGTTLKKAGSKEAFAKVDRDYVISLGRFAKKNNVPSTHIVSAIGANSRSITYYSRVKGEMEDCLKSLGLKYLVFYHPSLLHGDRDEFRLAETVGYYVLSLVGLLAIGRFKKYRPTEISELANVMLDTALRGGEGVEIVEMDNA